MVYAILPDRTAQSVVRFLVSAIVRAPSGSSSPGFSRSAPWPSHLDIGSFERDHRRSREARP